MISTVQICFIFSQDESKLKELTLMIEHLTDDAQKKRKWLDQETTETLTAQVRYSAALNGNVDLNIRLAVEGSALV